MATTETRTATPKAARGVPFLGVLPRLLADPAGLAVELMRATDEVVPLRVGPVTVYLVHHPDHLRHILLDNHQNYTKGPLFARADLLLGNGLVLNHGDAWLRQRRLMQPAFARQRLAAMVPAFAEVASARLSTWRQATGPLEMWTEMTAITMRALLKAMFGLSVDDQLVRRFDLAFDRIGRHVEVRGPTFFLPDWFPLPGRTAALAAVADLHAIVAKLVAERRQLGGEGDDLLGRMIAARDEDGSAMSEEQLRDEVKTLIFGGYDSTATGLAWTWYLLTTHPEAAHRAREEVLAVMPEGVPTAEQLMKLDYLGRCYHEALRLYPPFSFHPRMALKEDTVGGCRIPAGATLLYSNYAPGRNPAFWSHPDSFHPDHFLADQVAARHRFAYQAFSAGPRMCIGASMAALEAKTVLALGLRDYDLVRAANVPVMQARFGTTRAKGGIHLEVRPRAAV